jgi:hypothetical protein
MTEHQTLDSYLTEWAGENRIRTDVATTVSILAESCTAIAEIIALGPLAGALGAEHGSNVDGDVQKELDLRANEILLDELRAAPVAWVSSEELETPLQINQGAPLYVAVDPLDGSSNIDTNVSVGTIFSVMPMDCGNAQERGCLLQKGDRQLAAAYVIYGPQTALLLTLGEGTHIFTLNPDTGEFCLTAHGVQIPVDTHEFAILRSYSPDNPNARFARSRFDNLTPDAYLLTGGIILPVDHNNQIMYNDAFTPVLIDIRTAMEFNIRQRSRVLELAQMTVAFAGSVAGLGGFYNPSGVHVTKSGGKWTGLSRLPRKVKPDVSLQRRGPVKVGPHAVQTRKKITTPDMLKWENEDGHTLRRHSWQLTEDKLKERVLKNENFMAAPRMQRGGITPPDYRVWRGKKSAAASKWTDQSTMHKAIGDVIDSNLVEIRRVTKGGNDIVFNNKPFGSKTGEGWVTTAGTPRTKRAIFYNRELTGVTIVIKPRKNHVPTPQDPEGWYVYTAFPDAVR